MNLYRFFLLAILTLSFAIFTSAQDIEEGGSAESYNRIDVSTRISEFGRLNLAGRAAKLDNFLIELQNNPGSTGYILFYQGKDVSASQYGLKGEDLYLPYLRYKNNENGIVFVNAFRENQMTEFWVVPAGGTVPQPTNTVAPPAATKNDTFLYHRSHFEVSSDDFLLPRVLAEREAAYEEYSLNSIENYLEESTPPAETAPRENDAEDFVRSGYQFAEKVKENGETRGLVIFYVDDKMFDVGKVKEDIKRRIEGNASQVKIGADKFELVFGGYRSGIDIEMWVVPKTAKTPEARPNKRTSAVE